MATPAPTSRKREPIQGDEEAGAELKLGEFQDVDALTHSEAALVINALVAKRKMDRKNVNDTEYDIYVRRYRIPWDRSCICRKRHGIES
jgi:DNA-directed RNA polymerase II subunit RPB4